MLYNIYNTENQTTLVVSVKEAHIMFGKCEFNEAKAGYHPTLVVTEQDAEDFLDSLSGYEELPVDMDYCF